MHELRDSYKALLCFLTRPFSFSDLLRNILWSQRNFKGLFNKKMDQLRILIKLCMKPLPTRFPWTHCNRQDTFNYYFTIARLFVPSGFEWEAFSNRHKKLPNFGTLMLKRFPKQPHRLDPRLDTSFRMLSRVEYFHKAFMSERNALLRENSNEKLSSCNFVQ